MAQKQFVVAVDFNGEPPEALIEEVRRNLQTAIEYRENSVGLVEDDRSGVEIVRFGVSLV